MMDSRFEFDDMDFTDESIISVKDDVKRQLAEAGLDEEQAEYNAQFLASGLSTFANRAGMSTEELYRSLGRHSLSEWRAASQSGSLPASIPNTESNT